MLTKRLPIQFNAEVSGVVPITFQSELAFQPKQEFGGTDEAFALAFRGRRGVYEGIEVVGEVEGHDGANVGKGGLSWSSWHGRNFYK